MLQKEALSEACSQADVLMIHGGKGTTLTFVLLLIPLGFLGAADGVMDAAFTGQAAYLPFHYYQAQNHRPVGPWKFTLCVL